MLRQARDIIRRTRPDVLDVTIALIVLLLAFLIWDNLAHPVSMIPSGPDVQRPVQS